MNVPPEIRAMLKASDFDAVEDAWLAHLEEAPQDHGFFTTITQALQEAGEEERVLFLLEMLDEQLSEKKQWESRLAVLRTAGSILYEQPSDLHPAIVETLRQRYTAKPSFEALAERIGLHRAPDDIPKIWKKVDRLITLLGFDIGSIVRMEGKGAGRVEEVNMALESFKVVFEHHGEIRVGFGGAAKLLQHLPKEHILRRKTEEKDALLQLEPAGLLRIALESYDSPRSGAEIRRDVAGLVDESQWASWWATARKHPQVLIATKGRRAYSWAATNADAQGAIWSAFEKADTRTRINMLRRDGEREPQLKTRMAASLAKTGATCADDDPGLACEIWFGLERSGEAPEDAPWSPANLVAAVSDPRSIATGINDRVQRERIYTMVREQREDWPRLFEQLMWRETDPRALDMMAGALVSQADNVFDSLFDNLLSQPRKAPAAFTWLAERAAEQPTWLTRNPLRFLKQILWALNDGGFSSYRVRLAELSETGATVPRLLPELNEEEAALAADAIEKAGGLESYQRKPLLNSLFLKFPSLREEEEAPLYAIPESITAKREELRRTLEEEIPTNRTAIEEARALGDLRENFEYKSARQRHEYLSARAAALNHDLARARPIDTKHIDGENVVIGARVHLEGEDDARRTITILGPWESQPEEGILANESELAQSLIGKKLGDDVKLPDGPYRITRIEPFR